jgi:hypothetical protein
VVSSLVRRVQPVRYTAAWMPSTAGEYQINSATLDQFNARGWRLKIFDRFTV